MMADTVAKPMPRFQDNFWESSDKNGITTLIERMRGAKQTCERYKHAYEARIMLEEEYGKTLLQIAQKQKASSMENGSSKAAMDAMQHEFMSVAESHLHLSKLLRENVATPLSALLNKQKVLRKEAQTSIQKLYNNRQIQVHFVRRAHKRHNLEIEKANLMVQQQATENDKRAAFKMAEITIEKLKKVYDEALADLDKIVQDWNVEWRKTCESFEQLEVERLEFFKSNLSNCANLMIGCLENEVQACERVNTEALKVNVAQDLAEFVETNKSSEIVPSPMEYIKLHAYHEANQDRGDLKHTHHILRDNIDAEDHSESEDRVRVHLQHRRRRSSVSSMASEGTSSISKSSLLIKAAAAAAAAAASPTTIEDKTATLKETAKPSSTPAADLPSTEPVLMMGVMEVYPSDEEDDEEEYEYVTETDTDCEDEAKEEQVEVIEAKHQEQPVHVPVSQEANQPKMADTVPASSSPATDKDQGVSTKSKQDDKVDRLKSAYQEIRKERQASPSSLLAKQPFNPQRRVSFVEDTESPIDISKASPARIVDPTTTALDRAPPAPAHQNTQQQEHGQGDDDDEEEDYEGTSESAAFELDDMLRELDSKRIARSGGEESTRSYRHPDIKPTASMSSPSLLQQQQQQRRSIPSQYYQQQPPSSYQASGRRMSSIEPIRPAYSQSGSLQSSSSSNYMDLYDPFNSLSSKETGTISTKDGSIESHLSKSTTPPSVQLMHERMLKDKQQGSYHGSVSSSSSSGGSVRSIGQQAYHNNKFIQDYYRVGSNQTPVAADETTKEGHFIDFAFALYDYEASDEGEIGFSEGDLLGIISKNEDEEQGWWEASLLNSRNQKIVRTGLVPSNFLETASSTTK
ncbi:uncharacterized protein ATC70_008329 [Mucor velutinosus]|uniref:Uncharacterized protein n=1 Tax=Mucor velutinosus TaxID=708070 RepID=A0AAN7DP28_9FUNG|nr:hypothetical protein ATC70_008329 [Mucor velutinosus]